MKTSHSVAKDHEHDVCHIGFDITYAVGGQQAFMSYLGMVSELGLLCFRGVDLLKMVSLVQA